MKRVLLLCNKVPFPPRDGSTIAMASTIRSLIHAGAEVTVLALNTAKHKVVDFSAVDKPDGVNWNIIDVNTSPSFTGLLSNTLFSTNSYMVTRFDRKDVRRKLRRILESEAFDAALIEGLFMMPYSDEFTERKIPVYMRAHNVEHQIWERHIQREKSVLRKAILKIQNRRLKKYETSSLSEVKAVLPITDVDAQWFLKSLNESQVYTLPCGINPESYPNYPSSTPDVFHIGAMDWLPNVDGIKWFAQKVWPELMKINRESSFHLAGRQSDTLGIHRPELGFFVEGQVRSAEKFYEKHGIFVVPLLSGSGMRIKVLEAMAYGKAIIGTTIAVEGIPIESGVHGIIADQPREFAKAIDKLIVDSELRLELGKNARKLVQEKYDEHVLGVNLLNFMAR
ncbi:glycosyltransferase [Phaeocystidibacter luteus]|uniref:Glycosyltransferase n=1 Tax=Phaeocystidibacter luteus TaxID=911197 RepID=A0A6N6RIR1_9FLAO|nr:glycosyltransferase [Phaeocystidibacter luteus]KAB2814276.1 glycosyltransferase [Phaeocystidibacter luteus]